MKDLRGSGKTISIAILIRIYRCFENQKLKVFLVKDFGNGRDYIVSHLKCLAKLKLIERVPCVYKSGNGYHISLNTTGWRFVR